MCLEWYYDAHLTGWYCQSSKRDFEETKKGLVYFHYNAHLHYELIVDGKTVNPIESDGKLPKDPQKIIEDNKKKKEEKK